MLQLSVTERSIKETHWETSQTVSPGKSTCGFSTSLEVNTELSREKTCRGGRCSKQFSPVDDALAAQVAQSQRQLTHVEFDGALREVDVLLEVIAQVSSQEQVHHHEHVLLVLEGIPARTKRVKVRRVEKRHKGRFGKRCANRLEVGKKLLNMKMEAYRIIKAIARTRRGGRR